MKQQPQQLQQQQVSLDGLLGHLSACSGLYSKETFLSLYSCITRMIRDHRMRGLVLTRTLADEAFSTMAIALKGLPDLSLFLLDDTTDRDPWLRSTGFLIVLTDRFCAHLHWTSETQDIFRMYEGGWTFNPGDVRTIAGHVIQHLDQDELKQILEDTAIDRRYDEKLNLLLTGLVNGLENRNRELVMALEKVSDLNKKVVHTERLAAIGQLCSVIAHEIRNPLGLIDLYAKLVEEQLKQLGLGLDETVTPLAEHHVLKSLPLEKQELLSKNLSFIRQSTTNLEAILKELSDYSRPLELQLESVDISSLTREVCEFYEPSFQEKKVALRFLTTISDSIPLPLELLVDVGRIRQALINLIKNALEASSPKSLVTVTVTCRKSDPFVYVKVSDQGAGVPSHIAPKLFNPYFSTKGNGTGLGLAHSRKILQAHGGNVELLSNPVDTSDGPESSTEATSIGATFAIILPRTLKPLEPSP